MATKQKSIEDYRNAVKLLKLKVIKLQKQNEELQEKLREQGIPVITEDNKGIGQLTNQSVMMMFGRSCKRLGLTPEMLFRASDVQATGCIKVEDFRLFLSKIRLGLSQAQITLIVRIIDEDCSGIVKKEEYFDCLQAYGINEEKNLNTTRTYGQESLLKYAMILLQQEMTPENSYAKMDPVKKGTIQPLQFSNFTHQIDVNATMNEKEIVAAFNHIDIDRQGTVQQIFYEQEVRKAMKASASGMGMTGSNVFGSSAGFQQTQTQTITQQQQAQQLLKPQETKIMNQSSANMDKGEKIVKKREFEGDRQLIKQSTDKMRAQGIDPIDFVRILMKKMQNPNAGLMLFDIYQSFEHFGKNISKADQLKFFEAMDLGGNGSIDFDELMMFYWEYKSLKDHRYDGLFEILVRKLQAINFDIKQYLALEQVYEDTQLDLDAFHLVAQMLFNVFKKEQSEALFKFMDQDGQGILDATEIMRAVNDILEVFCPQPKLTVDQSMIKSMKFDASNLNEYELTLRKLKPTLTEKDYFSKHEMIGKGRSLRIKETKWKTIFNSDLACLRYCCEVVKELEKNPGSKWEDPEFGATKTDEFGSHSMYIADNDIPSGCPQPKEVQWKRPEQILAELIEAGHDELKECPVSVFDEDGAGSNDVCQSKYLGNCWFISALSIIAGYDKYLRGEFTITKEAIEQLSDDEVAGMQKGVYPPCFQFLQKYGMYVMRFYKDFGWRYVVIDDRICMKQTECIYGKCRKPTELWVNLIEKAYAKLHNCYYALTSGDIAQGLADMTGLVADKTKLDNNQLQTPEQKDKLWQVLVQSKQNGTMMGCSAEGDTEVYIKLQDLDTGIMSGHAYGIIDIFEISDENTKNYHKSHRLLKVRNPWGYGEWKLKWSENPDYSDKLDKFWDQIMAYYDKAIADAKKAGVEPPERYERGKDDGTFLMCYKSWRTVFSNLFQCINFPPEWSGLRGHDKFGFQSSGVPTKVEATQISYAQKNPQYLFDLKRADGKDSEVYVQLKQLDGKMNLIKALLIGRLFKAEKYPYPNVMKAILVCVYKLDSNEQCLQKYDPKKLVASSEKLNLRREVDSNTMILSNGRYAIIPCTKKPGEYAEFSINIYYNCKHNEIAVTKYGDPKFKFNVIKEFEEDVKKANEDLKKLLKKQAQDYLNAQ